eukprot:g20065.t1
MGEDIYFASRRMTKPAVILALGLGAACMSSLVAQASDGIVPLPFAKPDSPLSVPAPLAAPSPALVPVPDITGSIPRTGRPLQSTALRSGLDALSDNKALEAITIRDGLPTGSLDRRILTWAIASSGLGSVSYDEITTAQSELAGWPGLESLRAKAERALYRENAGATRVLAAFANRQPETPEGAIALARAQVNAGRSGEAARTIRSLWISEPLDPKTEDRLIGEFGGLLTVQDHKSRMDYLMYRGRTAQARRFATMGQAQSLFKAWVGVAANAKNTPALISAVEPSWANDPAFLFVRIEHARKQEKYEEAAKLLEKGDFKAAYRLTAEHVALSPVDRADAEFHAGWYALRALHEPARAQAHFRKILDSSSRPLSASRAWYWLGRAAEEGGPGDAHVFYQAAARYSGTFYGQLAGAKLGKSALDVSYPFPSAADKQNFEGRDVVRAIARLDAVGHDKRASALYAALSEQVDRPGELAMLTARAEAQGDHALSLKIGKAAFARGVDVAALAFPVGVIPAGANIEGSGKALAYAIARQESAFNPAAVSPANARGLLQILPTTAQGVAKRHGISYKADRLTTDAAYNATLGAHYLGEQIDTFGGSYILTFIAYNAGPKRVSEWIARYGDPRGKPIEDVIDWVERIPFPETRNYVQRVLENYQVYKTRLGQKADIVSDLRFGRL